MPFVIKKFHNARLLIIGDGPEKDNLINLSKKLNLENNVIFTGNIKYQLLPEYYATSDIFVLPSIVEKSGDTEGLGVVLLEAIASATAVVGSDVGGIPDIIRDNETGLLVRQKDPKDIADAILKLLSNNLLRKKLSKNAKEHLKKNYSWVVVSKKFERIYDSL